METTNEKWSTYVAYHIADNSCIILIQLRLQMQQEFHLSFENLRKQLWRVLEDAISNLKNGRISNKTDYIFLEYHCLLNQTENRTLVPQPFLYKSMKIHQKSYVIGTLFQGSLHQVKVFL